MKQAIAGVTPAETAEVTSIVVWPSISATGPGRFLGRLYSIDLGFHPFTVGHAIALLSIPVAVLLYFYRLAPQLWGGPLYGVTYKLTNRRIVELKNEIQRFPALVFAIAAGAFFLGAYWLAQGLELSFMPRVLLSLFVGLAAGSAISLAVATLLYFRFGVEVRSVALDRYDNIRVDVQPGQEWFFAGDLVFLLGEAETFRLQGVARPNAFRAACMKAHLAYVGVKRSHKPAAAAAV